MKMYRSNNKGNKKKYRGGQYDILDIKLQILYDYYTKIRLDKTQFYLVFLSMLKERALDFYYNKISRRLYEFTKIVEITKAYFKTKENRQKYLSK